MKDYILAVHLYNDYSGSPKVLAKQLQNWQEEGRKVLLMTSNSQGFLSHLKGITTINFNYQYHANKWIRLWRFFVAQLVIMLHVWKLRREVSCLYVNTLLPFGASLVGRLNRQKVIYHIHETSVNPAILKNFLKKIASLTAHHIIYVSNFLRYTEPIQPVPATVIYNSLEKEFIARANAYLQQKESTSDQVFTCLMACSLKKYKGIDQYLMLAKRLPAYRFELVLNATSDDIKKYFEDSLIPDNLIVFPVQQDMHWFYQRANLVLNLSLPDQWVETFGMTLLEAMAYGKVVIGPAVGGPTEVIIDQQTGFQINSYEIDQLVSCIKSVATNHTWQQQIGLNAWKRSQAFLPSFENKKAINALFSTLEETELSLA